MLPCDAEAQKSAFHRRLMVTIWRRVKSRRNDGPAPSHAVRPGCVVIKNRAQWRPPAQISQAHRPSWFSVRLWRRKSPSSTPMGENFESSLSLTGRFISCSSLMLSRGGSAKSLSLPASDTSSWARGIPTPPIRNCSAPEAGRRRGKPPQEVFIIGTRCPTPRQPSRACLINSDWGRLKSSCSGVMVSGKAHACSGMRGVEHADSQTPHHRNHWHD